jgi:DNA-binding transcriptional ArsR family regulator
VPGDPAFRRLLYYLLASTRGGFNRVPILRYLKANPVNGNKLSIALKLDDKTVQHHIKILQQNQLIISSQKDFDGEVYFVSSYLEAEYLFLEEIWAQVVKSSKETPVADSSRRTRVSFFSIITAGKLPQIGRSSLCFSFSKSFSGIGLFSSLS